MPGNIEVLVVEDNPDDAELTLRGLRGNEAGKRVQHVEDGERAIDFIFCRGEFAARPPDVLPKVVLLDLKLPGLDGLEVLRRIRGDARTHMLPVVVFAAACDERSVRDSYEMGANSYVVKPPGLSAYLDKVAAIGRYWLSFSRAGHIAGPYGFLPG